MGCLTCRRRKKECDDRRPRCSTCKTSHLRCEYDSAPRTFQFHHEYPQTHRQPPAGQRTRSISPSAEDRLSILPDPSDEAFFREVISFWDDSLVHPEPFEDPSLPGLPFDFLTQNEPLSLPPGTSDNILLPATNSPGIQSGMSGEWSNSSPNERRRLDGLPTHLLAQHYSRTVAGRFSSKNADWTFYTYFFHRFSETHRWVLSSIFAWTSTNLYYSGKVASLQDASQHYSDCLERILTVFGVTVNTADLNDSGLRGQVVNSLVGLTPDDIDAMFVAYFFLALVNLMTAQSDYLRKILIFVSHLLHIPDVKAQLTGVRGRVISWFCILDAKASAFQSHGGAVLKAMGDEECLVSVLQLSCTTLRQAYSVTYPDEELSLDELQLPLLELMLRLITMLHDITDAKHQALPRVEQLRERLDTHVQALQSISTVPYHSRSQFTFQVVCALYHSVEISFSRVLKPNDERHAADAHAVSIIQISQRLRSMQPAALRDSPPRSKIWPLPLVMAAVEVKDIIYREWAIDLLGKHEQTAGEHYTWSRKFAEQACNMEDKKGTRLNWSIIMGEVKDGLVI